MIRYFVRSRACRPDAVWATLDRATQDSAIRTARASYPESDFELCSTETAIAPLGELPADRVVIPHATQTIEEFLITGASEKA